MNEIKIIRILLSRGFEPFLKRYLELKFNNLNQEINCWKIKQSKRKTKDLKINCVRIFPIVTNCYNSYQLLAELLPIVRNVTIFTNCYQLLAELLAELLPIVSWIVTNCYQLKPIVSWIVTSVTNFYTNCYQLLAENIL